MNYIRGAVNAISAPYQYYKDLPPINPATLTGAVDVIVIQRPSSNGDKELVCSPFHVRFGKWQILRPGEKQVNVSVNGSPIPFNMKIGEAGEAFFVFETEDDVPADLITSPILQPTRPDESKDSGIPVDRLDTREAAATGGEAQEPEFLDLDAMPSSHRQNANSPQPSSLNADDDPSKSLPSPPPSPPSLLSATPASLLARTGTKMDVELKVDALLKVAQQEVHTPEVQFKDNVALDMLGYHSHQREESDRTVVYDEGHSYSMPGTSSRTPQASRSPSPESTSVLKPEKSPPISIPFPALRVTSPDVVGGQPLDTRQDTVLTLRQPIQEYSWEWGAFPQPSPMKTSFGKGGRMEGGLVGGNETTGARKTKGKSRLSALSDNEEGGNEGSQPARSQSVPPGLEGSPSTKRRELPLASEHDGDHDGDYDPDVYQEPRDRVDDGDRVEFGEGGRLTANKTDPTRLAVSIEGRRVEFELSLVSPGDDEGTDDIHTGQKQRGRKNRDGVSGGTRVFDGRDEVEAARIFDKGKLDYHRFMDDDDAINDERLVIRWAGTRYITRNDGSPLMSALVLWRDTAKKASGLSSRPSSPPLSEDEDEDKTDVLSADERQDHKRSKSEPPEQGIAMRKPTSSSWVRWWGRSRSNKEAEVNGKGGRPSLKTSSSVPFKANVPQGLNVKAAQSSDSFLLDSGASQTAPALPSTPDTRAVEPLPRKTSVSAGGTEKKKFAKTLRLTSDQLKRLNLKPGKNTITFSLSTSGVIACMARIFVWDSTDLVVVSDIDGTITKSDGLGHVFAMIGRDWTHVGVAKLYTDISRNGYKIMYLTSRAIGQADATRDYLKGIKQNDYQLPEGPVIMSPDRLMASLHREVIMRKPEVFKMACLRDIQRLFGEASRNPFYGGFGNRITDALSYRSVDVPSARIFTIDSSGEVKMELLELAGYKSSYIHMTDLVDQMFPPIHRKWAPEFTDFNFWKVPVQEFALPDLTPPSPALSARSDTSNQSTLSRLRNFSLVGTRQTNNMKQPSVSPDPEGSFKSTHLRQMSSLERLSTTLAGFTQSSSSTSEGSRRSVSPDSRSSSSLTYADSGSEDEDGDYGLFNGEKRYRRTRRRSMTSMPGSLDDMQFGDVDEDGSDEDDVADGEDEEVEDEEEAAEEAFDEDFLATGEMKDVPFL